VTALSPPSAPGAVGRGAVRSRRFPWDGGRDQCRATGEKEGAGRGAAWVPLSEAAVPSVPRSRELLGVESPQGQLQNVRAGARAVIGRDEVVADPERVEDHAAGLDLVLVRAEGTE
jgi:hypothetical protein